MRILFLTPFLPDPDASHGGGSYIGSLAEGLRSEAELGLVHLQHPAEGAANPSRWQWRASADYQGAPSGAAHRLRMLWRWRSRPLLVAKYWQAELPAILERARAEFSPDIALVEMTQMAQYLPYLDGLPTIFTDHEAGQPANKSTGLGTVADRRDDGLWRQYVAHFYPMATEVQAVTQEDADSLAGQLNRSVHVRPATISIPSVREEANPTPPHALFLGDYNHSPNPEAARRLAKEIWPLVRESQPTAKLLLAGPNDSPIRPLAELPGVEVLGFVEDLAELFAQARLLLAPLWSGGGFRAKSATALAHGVPVVTNELGSRGCRAPAPACSVAESISELAAATSRLLLSPQEAAEAGHLAREWAIERYAPEAVARLQLDRIRALL